ncbi:MAG: hypothetical protein J1E03_07415 [Acetatifactor sp.]|nr:hypothetical protein [Acetatifactor sp.]
MFEKKIKKILIVCCLILCLCSGCTYNNQNNPNSLYVVMNINGSKNNGEDDYYFTTYREIHQFSVSEQEIINSVRYEDGEDGAIDNFAVCDEYIFFLTDVGWVQDPEKIWRYDRESRIYELFLETRHCGRMTVYDGNLLYGRDDIYVCPIDGNPDEDCVSLLEQFPDTDSIVPSQEILYQGWRIWRVYLKSRHTYRIMQIVDEENDEVILSNFLSDSIGSWPYFFGEDIWMDGEWIYFTKDAGISNFYYQKGYESERQKIDCLNDRQYRKSEINTFNMTVEGEKLIGILSVSKDPLEGHFLYQEDIKKDVLFEIDLENDSSRIIYSTENNKTRIIGYQKGIVYLLKDDVIYEEDIERKKRKELLDLREEDFYDAAPSSRREFRFYWQGSNLIIEAILDGEVNIKSISISDQEL